MSSESMVTVTAGVGDIVEVSEAGKVLLQLYFEKIETDLDGDPEVESFLFAVASGTAFRGGNRGDVLLWGGSWNYFRESDFTPWVARLIEHTPDSWTTNIHISWESEQTSHRQTKVFWFSNNRLIWAFIPSNIRMHWGVCSQKGPIVSDGRIPGGVILDLDGEKDPPTTVCHRCGGEEFFWFDYWRRCPTCSTKVPVLKAYYWKDEGDD